ncbi:PepSY domain-containing protein [Azonexus sp.]|uniref:PepSY domain-containing protein n=1 Tax=Azonexus sp. TaxID=1872668 RepID=UPI0027BA97A7|nr:PepSY domain-containing protein [Azonexus sp.]
MLKLLSLLLLSLSLASPAAAEEQYVIRRAVEAGQLKPLSDILSGVQTRHAGKVLDVDLERDRSGRRVYEITILKNSGQRTKILVDATSGIELASAPEANPAARPTATALRSLLAKYPGHILELELKQGADARLIYEIQIIQQDGRLREFVIDARTGELINASGHRQEVLRSLKTLPDILDRLPARYRGVVQEIELEYDQEGRYFYEIEVRLADGRVFELDVDAISGKILNGEEVER